MTSSHIVSTLARPVSRRALLGGVAGAAGVLVAACSTLIPSSGGTNKPSAPVQVQQPGGVPAVPVPAPAAAPAGFAAPSAGPNLLAKNWSERLGVIVSPMQKATGKAILNPKAGDLWFFSNASTTWGATNTKNSVWVVDAKTKQTVAEVAPPNSEENSSHGIAVSGDGRFIYLPQLGQNSRIDVLDGRTLEVVQSIKTLGRPHHQKLWHDPNTNKDLIIGEDFNWGRVGSGFYVIDPSQENAVVGGLSNGDFQGNPYYSTPSPDGKFIIVTVPAPEPAFRDKMDGWVAKVNPKTWKVIGMTPMKDPIWGEVSLDGKWAYVTSGGDSKIYKIDLETMKIEHDVLTGPGPWGAKLSYDGSKIYTADKGEGPGYNQQGRTTTIIDLQTMGVSNVVVIGQTTDHVLLSPDGKEAWYTSNAEHSIYVLDTATEKITHVIKDPADGDIHGGVWVQYRDDGKGGVIGEVVSDYAGLHGGALAAQMKYVAEPAIQIAMNRTGFTQKAVTAEVGKAIRITLKHTAGTSAGKITFESKDMGIALITLEPGNAKEIRWTAPAGPVDFKAQTNKTPNGELTVSVKAPAAKPAAAPAATGGPQVINLTSEHMAYDIKAITVKPGAPVRFVVKNLDDEKHNLVGIGEGLNLLSPDIGAGQTVTYEWAGTNTPGTYRIVCAYHPAIVIEMKVQ
ncbi:MAG: hypothetical protein EPO26_15460 [Chloroflexota bacterium]|nr:MAG: hypothetical protein EPO26_15460 [Chloroflexota bacterium]